MVPNCKIVCITTSCILPRDIDIISSTWTLSNHGKITIIISRIETPKFMPVKKDKGQSRTLEDIFYYSINFKFEKMELSQNMISRSQYLCTEKNRTRGSSQNIFWVPLPWWTSQSTIKIFLTPSSGCDIENDDYVIRRSHNKKEKIWHKKTQNDKLAFPSLWNAKKTKIAHKPFHLGYN